MIPPKVGVATTERYDRVGKPKFGGGGGHRLLLQHPKVWAATLSAHHLYWSPISHLVDPC